jgi:hypothetical protein
VSPSFIRDFSAATIYFFENRTSSKRIFAQIADENSLKVYLSLKFDYSSAEPFFNPLISLR